jgi:CubicO group peptidase (beta-lactamase class C family)
MPTRARATLIAIALCAAAAAHSDHPLPAGTPAQVGMSAERLDRLGGLIGDYVEDRRLAGAVTLVAREGKVVYVDVQGRQDIETDAPMREDTLFRIYSMSKPITAVAAMILYEEGRFQLTDPVSKFLPEFSALTVWQDGAEPAPARPMTMQQLMTHTAGLSYGFTREHPVDARYQDTELLGSDTLDRFVTKLATIPLMNQPGERWRYSVASDVLGAVIERISGTSLDTFLAERLFRPLGMNDTFFSVPDDKIERFGTNHGWDADANALVVMDRPADSRFRNATFFSGGGGLVSTAADYMRFALMLASGGSFDGVRILSPKTVEFMTRNHLPATLAANSSGERPGVNVGDYRAGFGFGLGFGINVDPAQAGVIGSAGEYSWGGAAGTIFWVDPVEDLVVVSMIQLMRSPWPLRSELKVLTNQALVRLANED